MLITLDIETCPSQSPEVRAEFLANVKPPATYKKSESIAEWMNENAEAEAETAWRKTSFDGALGHICVVGVAIDDQQPQSIYSDDWHADEANVLRQLFSLIDATCMAHPNVRPTFIGHNLIEFDLRFMFQRCVVLGVKPSRFIPFNCKPWDDHVFDTMQRWGARAGGSLDKITRAIGLEGKGDIDGSMVWDYVRDGRIAEVAEYCKHDVALTRDLYKRMTFAEAA
jgi:hypothetical protein